MEDDKEIDPDYLKGFNEGYTIAQHMPDLATKLSDANKDTSRGSGFADGRTQYLSEQTRERLPAWLKGDRRKPDRPAPDRSPDRDVDPDR